MTKLEARSRLSAAQTQVTARYHSDRGTYMSVIPDRRTRSALFAHIRSNEIGVVTGMWDFHATVIWSNDALAPDQLIDLSFSFHVETKFQALPKEFKVWEGHDGKNYLVLLLDSPDLVEANARVMKYGITSTQDVYNPHVTVATGIPPDFDTSSLNRGLSGLGQLTFTGIRLEDAK